MTTNEKYEAIIEQCRAIIVTTITEAREMVLKGKWDLGELLITNWEELGGNATKLAQDLKVSSGELVYWKKFRETNPDFEKFMVENPWGKNVSWHKVVHLLLPEGSTGKEPEFELCPTCGKKWKQKKETSS